LLRSTFEVGGYLGREARRLVRLGNAVFAQGAKRLRNLKERSDVDLTEKVAHVVYRTRRFDDMLTWYTAVFDAKVQYANPAIAFLTYDDEHHRFAFANLSVIQPEGTETDKLAVIGVDHVAYTYASLGDLFENYAALKARGIAPYWCIHHGISVSMYYADPDGNQMEFQVDAFTTNEEANAFMHDRFAANPIGVEFDADAWLERLGAGAPESEFFTRTTDVTVSPIRGAMNA
jgi:catechol 2,3-dioxygenase-like lactoylglutathione lyase family enzyme